MYFTQSGTALDGGTSNGSGDVTVPSLKYFIGGTDENHHMKGTMYSLRIYNRLLTDEEMAKNNEADEVRFRGDGVIVCTQVDGRYRVSECVGERLDGQGKWRALP